MMSDLLKSLKELEFVPSSSQLVPEKESPKLKVNAWLSINLLKLPQLEKMFSYSEAQETEKLKDISVFTQVKKVLTLLPESDAKDVNGKEPEEEDDLLFKL